MKKALLALIIPLGLAACEEGRYPVSGESCTADDPVVQSSTIDCPPLPTGSGGL